MIPINSKITNLPLYFFLENSCNKASGLLFVFVCVSTSNTYFQRNEIHIFWELTRPAMLFFSCETTENTSRKAGFEIYVESFLQVINLERNLPSSKCLPVCKRLYLAFISHIWAAFLPVNGLLMCAENQTNIRTCIGTGKWFH